MALLPFTDAPRLPLTPEVCEAVWKAVPIDTIVGDSKDASDCPLARLLKTNGSTWAVCSTEVEEYEPDNYTVKHRYRTEVWQEAFVEAVDAGLYRSITASEALQILKRVRSTVTEEEGEITVTERELVLV